MVVSDDVSVLGDDYARAARTRLAHLGTAVGVSALRESEELQEGVSTALHLDLLDGLDIDHCLDGVLGRICKVGIVGRYDR